MNNLAEQLAELLRAITELKAHLNLSQKEQRISELDAAMTAPDFWNDNEIAQKVSQEYSQLKSFYDFWVGLERNANELLEMVKTNTDESAETVEYLEKQVAERRYR